MWVMNGVNWSNTLSLDSLLCITYDRVVSFITVTYIKLSAMLPGKPQQEVWTDDPDPAPHPDQWWGVHCGSGCWGDWTQVLHCQVPSRWWGFVFSWILLIEDKIYFVAIHHTCITNILNTHTHTQVTWSKARWWLLYQLVGRCPLPTCTVWP